MKTQVFLILALLCAVVQGAWADWSVWSGYNSSLPTYYSNYGGRSNVYVIRDASELAGVTWYWGNYFDKNRIFARFPLNLVDFSVQLRIIRIYFVPLQR